MRRAGLAILSGGCASQAASACTCDLSPPADVALAQADLVFAGRIEQIGGDGLHEHVRVTVSQLWKGPDAPEHVVLNGPGSCGLALERGEQWLFYAWKSRPGYVVDACSRSTQAVAAEAQDLGEPRVERGLVPIVPRPLEKAVAEMDAAAVRAAIAAGDTVQAPFLGGPPVDRAVAACDAEVVAALMAAGGWTEGGTHEKAVRCPNLADMVSALGLGLGEWSTELARAAARGQDERVAALLRGGAPVTPAGGTTPLAEALAHGHLSTVALLREHGAVLDRQALAGALRSPDLAIRQLVFDTPLSADDAAWLLPFAESDLPVLQHLIALLLDAGAVPEPLALRLAAVHKDLALVERLLAAGVPVNAGALRSGVTALEVAASVKGNARVVEALLAAGADPNAISSQGTALHAAVEAPVVELLLAAGADLRLRGRSPRWTALEKAASRGDPAVVEVLLAAGAPLASELPGQSALDHAARAGRLEIVELLLAHGAPPGGALAEAQGADVVRRLLKAQADPNLPGFHQALALHRAAARRDPESVALLLQAGADPDALDGEGHTALMAAVSVRLQAGREEVVAQIVELLLAGGASKAVQDANGRTAARHASLRGRSALAARLAP